MISILHIFITFAPSLSAYSFKSLKSVKSYVVAVEDPSKIEEKDIVAKAEGDNVNVTVAMKNANNGEKVITILLESEDQKDKRTGVYQVTVKKATAIEEKIIKTGPDKKIYLIFGGIIAVLVILIIIVIIALKKTSNNDDDDVEEYDDDNEEDDDDDDDGFEKVGYDKSLKNAIKEANKVYDYDKEDDDEDEVDGLDDDKDDFVPKSQILSKKPINNKVDKEEMDKTQFFDVDRIKTVDDKDSDSNLSSDSSKKGKHF